MCLLVFTREGVTPSYADLKTASRNNPDGFGWAIHADDRILVGKSMDFNQAYDSYVAARNNGHDGPSMFHLRIATAGTVDLFNCHPFAVPDAPDTYIGHNGILPIDVPTGDLRSDTHFFTQEWVPELAKGEPHTLWDDEAFMSDLGRYIDGNKLVILTVDPKAEYDWYIVNESDGHWTDADGVKAVNEDDAADIWWSNWSYSYEPRAVYTRTYPIYGGGGWGGGHWSEVDGGWDEPTETRPYNGQSDRDLVSICDRVIARRNEGGTTWELIECPICESQVYVGGNDYDCSVCDCCTVCEENWRECQCWIEVGVNEDGEREFVADSDGTLIELGKPQVRSFQGTPAVDDTARYEQWLKSNYAPGEIDYSAGDEYDEWVRQNNSRLHTLSRPQGNSTQNWRWTHKDGVSTWTNEPVMQEGDDI